MNMSIPTRITIELEPADERRGGWRARTRIDGRPSSAPAMLAVTLPDPEADASWMPAAYEPGPCTCDAGLCDRDHDTD